LRDGVTKLRNKTIGVIDIENSDIPEKLKFDEKRRLFLKFDSGVKIQIG
jgi:hypothetical protein